MFELGCGALKEALVANARGGAAALAAAWDAQVCQAGATLEAGMASLVEALSAPPSTVDDYAELLELADKVAPARLAAMTKQLLTMRGLVATLEELRFEASDELTALHWRLVGGPKQCLEAAGAARLQLGREHARFRIALSNEREALVGEFALLQAELEWLGQLAQLKTADEVAERALVACEKLEASLQRATRVQARESIFDLPPCEVHPDQVHALLGAAQQHAALWTLASEALSAISDWLHTEDVRSLQPGALLASVRGWLSSVGRLEVTPPLCDQKAPRAALGNLRGELETFCSHERLLRVLSSQSVRARHWRALAEATGIEALADAAQTFDAGGDLLLTLGSVLEGGAAKQVEPIEAVGAVAEAEFKVEAELVAISTNLLAVELGTVPFRDSGTQVLAQPTAAADALEALHLRLDLLRSSAATAAPFAATIAATDAELSRAEAALSLLQRVQAEWVRLQQ
eukprot:Transcript_20978.p1 GENE.Transcript_20978~~Transcript_20978.p1  ORF type:complete len:463 (-),score=161.53 Transcript_20978:5-1393(-)